MGAIAGVLALLAVVAAGAYSTGGTHATHLHFAHLSILFAASGFGVIGGLAPVFVAGEVFRDPRLSHTTTQTTIRRAGWVT